MKIVTSSLNALRPTQDYQQGYGSQTVSKPHLGSRMVSQPSLGARTKTSVRMYTQQPA